MGGNGPHAPARPGPLRDALVGTRVASVLGLVTESLSTGTGTAVPSTADILICQLLGYSTKGVTRSHMNQRCRSKRPVGVEQRRALRLLASIPFGATETIMLAHHGFKRRMLADLLHAGLATLERASVNMDGKAIGARRVRITAAGRSALED
jgi:hypothetical protein